MIIDGKKTAEELLAKLKMQPRPEKFMTGVLVGDDAASRSFQKIKERAAKELGVDYRIYEFPASLGNDGLRDEVGKIARHKTCGGVIVQLPLPDGLNRYAATNTIPPEKDPDVLSERSLGAFYNGRNKVFHPAAATVSEVLRRAGFDL
ncbi:MAG TPA: tetrahydrofolate dehydrogenase/cyclohydrolase catalytic domain-containing protein, partial [Candidatus Paceibacterota bacterium]|nr:tetrahydrofolate dehydrogenase/cyclohydrolase catalytic domain-containing protein [Candidatus Paceibacterota bacterium]